MVSKEILYILIAVLVYIHHTGVNRLSKLLLSKCEKNLEMWLGVEQVLSERSSTSSKQELFRDSFIFAEFPLKTVLKHFNQKGRFSSV